jgi:hypothetical protein
VSVTQVYRFTISSSIVVSTLAGKKYVARRWSQNKQSLAYTVKKNTQEKYRNATIKTARKIHNMENNAEIYKRLKGHTFSHSIEWSTMQTTNSFIAARVFAH